MEEGVLRRIFVPALCAGFLVFGPVQAEESSTDNGWQFAAGVSYHAAKWVDIAFVYRYLEWDIGGDFVDDLNFSGPALGAVFRF